MKANYLSTKNHLVWCIIVCFILLVVSSHLLAQTKRALLIGISQYPSSKVGQWPAIHGTNDIELLAPVLSKQGFKTTKVCNSAATATRIRKEMNALLAKCQKGDIIYLHFSGHGQPYEDLNGDEEDGWDEAIIPYDAMTTYAKGIYEGKNHIIDDELHQYLCKLRHKIGSKGLVCMVIDACNSGGASRGDEFDDDNDDVFVRGTKKGFSPTWQGV